MNNYTSIYQNNTILDVYKHHIVLYFKLIILITLVGLFERGLFAIFHSHLSTTFTLTEIIYTLLWGMKFDLALAGFFGVLYILTAYILKRIFSISENIVFKFSVYLFISITFLLQAGDIIYYYDAARHLGYEITDLTNDAPQLLSTALNQYKAPFLIHLAIYPILLFLVSRLINKNVELDYKLSGIKTLNLEIIYFSLFLLSLIFARGGLQSIPIEPLHAQEISHSTKASLALNGAYNAIFNIFNKDSVKQVPIDIPESLDTKAILENMYPNKQVIRKNEKTWQPNIIFIFLESWPAMYMQSYGYDKNTTPFFDALRNRSLSSLEMIAGGHRTTEGLYTSLCSAQNPLGQTIAQSQLQEYQYYCLPHILRNTGYKTLFFQGSNKNTSGTGAFAQSLGFTQSYGKKDIKERKYEENYWGVYDQDLYDYAYKKLINTKEPVLFGINTNTTHAIDLPENVDARFPINESTPSILNSLFFADVAFQEFFEKVENNKDINDTLWVVVSDHTAGLKTSRYNNYRVPFLIYHKNKVKAKLVNRVASQRDIAPTLLDILNINSPSGFTGKTLLKSNNPPYFSDYYHSGIIGWIENNVLIEIPVTETSIITCYNYFTDKLQNNSFTCPASALLSRDNALAFTSQSQNLLFNGNK